MASVKTAISLNKNLLDKVDSVAQELEMPRSHLFVLAIEEFLKRRENQRLLEAINKAYAENPMTEEEMAPLQAMQRIQRELLEDEAW